MINNVNKEPYNIDSDFSEEFSSADVTNDASWFSSSLNDPTLKPPASTELRMGAAQPLVETSDRVKDLIGNAMRENLALNQTLSPVQTLKAMRSLSAVQLDLLLNTKVIGKTSQAIEKLTNLS